jgi:hypothetical protein
LAQVELERKMLLGQIEVPDDMRDGDLQMGWYSRCCCGFVCCNYHHTKAAVFQRKVKESLLT